MGFAYVYFGNFRTLARSHIPHVKRDGDRSGQVRRSRRQGQTAIFKFGVRQAEAERKLRLHGRAVEVPIAQEDAFLVFDLLVVLRIVATERGAVLPATLNRCGQFSGRADVSE